MYKFKTYLTEYTCTRYCLNEATGEIVKDECTGTFEEYEAITTLWTTLRNIALLLLLTFFILYPVFIIPVQKQVLPIFYGFIPFILSAFSTWLFCFFDNKRGELEQEAIERNWKAKNELQKEWGGFDTEEEVKAFRAEKIAQKLYQNYLTK